MNGPAAKSCKDAKTAQAGSFVPLASLLQEAPQPLDFSAIRARLAATRGQEFWRSLEELAGTPEWEEMLHREFPRQAATWTDPVTRRSFLKLMGASLALAGLSGCSQVPSEKVVPYVRQPEAVTPGKPLFFATAMSLGGYANGVLVESHEGRPTKIEGNPDHPSSLGSSTVWMQASILSLYDPDRSQAVLNRGQISTWEEFISGALEALGAQYTRKGAGLRVLTGTVTSPTLESQLKTLLAQLPGAQWHQYEPVGRDNVRTGAMLAFGQAVNPLYHFDKADVVLSLDADFLMTMPGQLRYAREFMDRRRVRARAQGQEVPGESTVVQHTPLGSTSAISAASSTMNRLYVVENAMTNTGAMADHRLPLRASDIEALARFIAARFGIGTAPPVPPPQGARTLNDNDKTDPASGEHYRTIEDPLGATTQKWIDAVVKDLQAHRGASLVLAGDEQPPVVHDLVHAINHALGNVGHTVTYTAPVEASPVDQMQSLRDLVQDMQAGRVEMLVIVGNNPVYAAPADLNFAAHLAKVPLRIHLGEYVDETAALCHWHIPEAHYLEAWSDTRAYDGTISIMQPLITPLYEGKTAHELISVLLRQPNFSSHDLIRNYWTKRQGLANFEAFWQKTLHDGLVANTSLTPQAVSVKPNFAPPPFTPPANRMAPALELVFRPDPHIWDGRFANNGWLQELPKPLTKITWDNVALVSPATAERLRLANEELVELRYRGRTVRAPIWIMPGHADNSVTVHLGYGRERVGRVGEGTGFNAYSLRTSDAPWFGPGLEIRKTGQRYRLARTEHHYSMEGRDIVRHATLEGGSITLDEPKTEQAKKAEEHKEEEQEKGEAPGTEQPSLYPEYKYDGYKWGMTIDLNACIGCNACTIGCQAENNIPIVGKTEVERGREMHWIRVDRYYEGGVDNPDVAFMPVPCMHCEKAPCEVVCPVEATVHSPEGINEMVYNRCVGTRYCSNNCPYKVRRFNFLQYSNQDVPTLKMVQNPDVTVRNRGVMEKCTYCIQRINSVRIEADKENRAIKDGEIVTACAQACPTNAIIFGDINNRDSQVAKLKREPHNYGLLTELNTQPRTTYLAKLRNPNLEVEAIEKEQAQS